MILALKAVWAFIKSMPWQLWAIVAALLLAWGYGELRYSNGKSFVQAKWDKAIRLTEQAQKEQKISQTGVTTKYEYITNTVVKTIYEKGKTIYKLRESFVPTDSGMLSGGFRLYYDAAITNAVPDTASIATAAPIAITDVADTHAYNAEQCNIAYAKYALWNKWVDEQCALNPKGCLSDGE